MLKNPAHCESDRCSVIVAWKTVGCGSRIVHHTLSQKASKLYRITEIERLTISHHDVHETPAPLLPERHRPVCSKGEDYRIEDHDTNPHQAKICYNEI